MYTVFIISDGTGITAEKFASSLLVQFDIEYQSIRLPFIDTASKVQNTTEEIDKYIAKCGAEKILVFTSLIHPLALNLLPYLELHQIWVVDLFQNLIQSLEFKLGKDAKKASNQSHSMRNLNQYEARIEAIDFSLKHDDGQSHQHLAQADLILIGVSRTGKTPTSLYLAMQYGLKAANYPIIPEDFVRGSIPKILLEHKAKLYGLSIEATRLASIRQQRRPNSHYASLENCLYEVEQAKNLFRRFNIPYMSSTDQSIEEIAIHILQQALRT